MLRKRDGIPDEAMGHCNDQDHQGVYSILSDVAKWAEDDLPGNRDTHSHLKKVYILQIYIVK